jgi:hypothetical protein
LYAINTEIAIPCMPGGNMLGWLCHTDLEDVMLFALKKGVPFLTTAEPVLLAHKLGLKLPRVAEQEEAITVARAVLCSHFPDLTPECTSVVLREFVDQVDQAPPDLPPSTLADPSLLDILLEMNVELPHGNDWPNDLQSVQDDWHSYSQEKASWRKHAACACINQCSASGCESCES